MLRAVIVITVTSLAALLPACTAEQLYVAGQGVHRNECADKLYRAEYDRCMRDANIPYDSYKRQTNSEHAQ